MAVVRFAKPGCRQVCKARAVVRFVRPGQSSGSYDPGCMCSLRWRRCKTGWLLPRWRGRRPRSRQSTTPATSLRPSSPRNRSWWRRCEQAGNGAVLQPPPDVAGWCFQGKWSVLTDWLGGPLASLPTAEYSHLTISTQPTTGECR